MEINQITILFEDGLLNVNGKEVAKDDPFITDHPKASYINAFQFRDNKGEIEFSDTDLGTQKTSGYAAFADILEHHLGEIE